MDQIWTLCLEKFTFQRYPWKKVEPECKNWNGILLVFQKRKRSATTYFNKNDLSYQDYSKGMTYWVSF